MPTIKDIARIAGVSQGTVSNVLNGRGNVSVEKINLVKKTAMEIGYRTNEQARLLRGGVSESIAIILPDITLPCYAQLYSELHLFFSQKGYTLQLHQTQDMPAIEKSILKNIESSVVAGIIAVSCLPNASKYYDTPLMKGITKVFALRKPDMECNFLGFDYSSAGREIAAYTRKKKYTAAALFSGPCTYANESEFLKEFQENCREQLQNFTHIKSEYVEINQKAFALASLSPLPECVILTNSVYVSALKNAYYYKGIEELPEFILLSCANPQKGSPCTEYQFDYRKLGQMIGEHFLTASKRMPYFHKQLKKTGFYPVSFITSQPSAAETLQLLTIDSPTTKALVNILPRFRKETGIQVHVTSLAYDETYNTIQSFGNSGSYDLFRLDMAWGQWFAKEFLTPFSSIKNYSEALYCNTLPELYEDYCRFNGEFCAFPLDPSVQLLFYRKDLFEDPVVKRGYYEKYKKELREPQTFEELNQIAKYFTKKYTPESPTDYGMTMVAGNTGMASCEVIPRLLAKQADAGAPLLLNSPVSHYALQNYLECSNYCANSSISWWNKAVEDFASGNTAMTIIFANHASEIIGSQSTRVAGKLGFSSIPGEKPLLGGGILGIAKASQKKEAAMELLKWLSRDDIALMLTLLGGTSGNTSVYTSPEIIQRYPWMPEVKRNYAFGIGRKNWLSSDQTIEERRIEEILGLSVRNALAGNISIEKAMDYAQSSINKLLHDTSGNFPR